MMGRWHSGLAVIVHSALGDVNAPVRRSVATGAGAARAETAETVLFPVAKGHKIAAPEDRLRTATMRARKPAKEGTARTAAADSLARPAGEGAQVAAPSANGSALPAVLIGRLVAGSTALAPVVEYPGNRSGPLRARATVPLGPGTVERAVVTRQGVTLVFENGDPRLPIVTGLLQANEPATPFQELLVGPRTATASGSAAARAPAEERSPSEARLDGERVVLEGKREIVLKCGDASITLRRDGKMVLRGAYIETYARGVNRIKGGSVKIN
jgi:hypothetical protein